MHPAHQQRQHGSCSCWSTGPSLLPGLRACSRAACIPQRTHSVAPQSGCNRKVLRMWPQASLHGAAVRCAAAVPPAPPAGIITRCGRALRCCCSPCSSCRSACAWTSRTTCALRSLARRSPREPLWSARARSRERSALRAPPSRPHQRCGVAARGAKSPRPELFSRVTGKDRGTKHAQAWWMCGSRADVRPGLS